MKYKLVRLILHKNDKNFLEKVSGKCIFVRQKDLKVNVVPVYRHKLFLYLNKQPISEFR